MAKLIVEVINRLGHTIERFKFDELPIRIGRAYNNDIILNDPHVSPEHLIIHDAEDQLSNVQWRVEDCDSLNGTQLKHHSITNENNSANLLSSGDDVIIGRTRLRFYAAWHSVPETHAMPTSEHIESLISRPAVAIGLILFTLLSLIINTHLLTATRVPGEKLIASALPVILGILVWAGAWAFAGRVMRHRTHFLVHLSITTLFALSLVILNNLGEYVAFLTSSTLVSRSFEFLGMGLLLFTLFNVNIENASAMSRKARLMMSHTLTWGFLIFSVFMDYANKPDFMHSPSFASQLKPPFARLVPSSSVDAFLAQSNEIFVFSD